MTQRDVVELLCETGVIPVVVVEDVDLAHPLGVALKAGGLPLAEVTLRTAGAVEAIRLLASDPDLLVGAGTVVSAAQVELARDAGARFVVTPGFSAAVVERCSELAIAVIPGVATATEVIAARDHGARLLKFFPAEAAGGTATLRALAAPFPDIRFVPTGGINAANAAAYLRLPTVAAVGGSWMVAPELLRERDFETIRSLTAQAVAIATEARR